MVRETVNGPGGAGSFAAMPTFDVVSELDQQEVRNAVDQAARELSQRYDFKGTDSSVELKEAEIELRSVSEDRLNAVRQVLEEKLVKRKVSLKALEYGKVEDAAGGTVRQTVALQAGISSDKARELNKAIKELGLKGVQSQTQGDQLRVTSKKRDDLQAVIAHLKEGDYGIPLQFSNFRD
jgi:cyclic-di-GMP-binding protein